MSQAMEGKLLDLCLFAATPEPLAYGVPVHTVKNQGFRTFTRKPVCNDLKGGAGERNVATPPALAVGGDLGTAH